MLLTRAFLKFYDGVPEEGFLKCDITENIASDFVEIHDSRLRYERHLVQITNGKHQHFKKIDAGCVNLLIHAAGQHENDKRNRKKGHDDKNEDGHNDGGCYLALRQVYALWFVTLSSECNMTCLKVFRVVIYHILFEKSEEP